MKRVQDSVYGDAGEYPREVRPRADDALSQLQKVSATSSGPPGDGAPMALEEMVNDAARREMGYCGPVGSASVSDAPPSADGDEGSWDGSGDGSGNESATSSAAVRAPEGPTQDAGASIEAADELGGLLALQPVPVPTMRAETDGVLASGGAGGLYSATVASGASFALTGALVAQALGLPSERSPEPARPPPPPTLSPGRRMVCPRIW